MTNNEHCTCPKTTVETDGKYHFSVCPGRTQARKEGRVAVRMVNTDGTLSAPTFKRIGG